MVSSDEEVIELCRRCAAQCITNAEKCRAQGMNECARLCMECANACDKAMREGDYENMLFQDCADACNACATECEAHDNDHCQQCAIICRECEEECYSIVD